MIALMFILGVVLIGYGVIKAIMSLIQDHWLGLMFSVALLGFGGVLIMMSLST